MPPLEPKVSTKAEQGRQRVLEREDHEAEEEIDDLEEGNGLDEGVEIGG